MQTLKLFYCELTAKESMQSLDDETLVFACGELFLAAVRASAVPEGPWSCDKLNKNIQYLHPPQGASAIENYARQREGFKDCLRLVIAAREEIVRRGLEPPEFTDRVLLLCWAIPMQPETTTPQKRPGDFSETGANRGLPLIESTRLELAKGWHFQTPPAAPLLERGGLDALPWSRLKWTNANPPHWAPRRVREYQHQIKARNALQNLRRKAQAVSQ